MVILPKEKKKKKGVVFSEKQGDKHKPRSLSSNNYYNALTAR